MEKKDIQRFWSKVDIQGENDCWEWTGRRHKGYGIFWLEGRNQRANRVSLYLSKGYPQDGEISLHSCDNPSCCNPRHLRWGTHQDNTDDRLVRTSDGKGENSPLARINNSIVSDIYKRRLSGETCREISASLNLPYSLVMNVYTGKSWSHLLGVDGNPTLSELRKSRPARKRKAHNRRLTDADVDRIFQARVAGISASQLAEDMGLPLGTVSPVHSGLAFTERLGKFGNPTLEELRSTRAANPAQKLFDDDIEEIVRLLKSGYTGKSIAQKFGVSPSYVSLIKKRHINC